MNKETSNEAKAGLKSIWSFTNILKQWWNKSDKLNVSLTNVPQANLHRSYLFYLTETNYIFTGLKFISYHKFYWASQVAQTIKNLPTIQETQVQSLTWENFLGEGMATHRSILAQRIPWTEGPDGRQSIGSKRVRPDWVTNTFPFHIFY